VQDWIKEIEDCAGAGVYKSLFGNKADCTGDKVVSTEEGKSFASKNGMAFFEGSAKAGINVEEVFAELARQVIAAWRREQEVGRAPSQRQGTVQLGTVHSSQPRQKEVLLSNID
jgi:GTPase SAR1 family protein